MGFATRQILPRATSQSTKEAPMTPTQRERRCLFAGYRIARAQAKRKREEMAEMFFATLDEIHAELSDVRS
jgi:hypothetical protein